jgi:flagellar protein FliS
MTSAYSLRSYQSVATQTAPPGQLVLMLYEGAIRFLERSLTGFQRQDPAEFHETINNNILRAQEILTHLNTALDLEQGGELALTLRRLYHYMDHQLTHSNIQKCPRGIQDTIARLSTLRDAWKEMLNQRNHRPEFDAPQLSVVS